MDEHDSGGGPINFHRTIAQNDIFCDSALVYVCGLQIISSFHEFG